MSVNLKNGAFYPGTTQNGTTTTSSQYTNAFGSTTSIIRVAVQNDTYIQPINSTSTTATVNSMVIPGGGVEFLTVPYNSRIAYLQVSSGGWVSVTELGSLTNPTVSTPAPL
jgi:hypothetical protein